MYKTLEEAQKAYDAKKSESREAYDKVKAFEKKNKLGFGKESTDKKIAKEHKTLKDAHKALKAELGVIEDAIKELKPKVERSSFVKKYDYPKNEDGSEMSADEKKAYRRKARSAAKKGENLEEVDEKKASKKADKKEEKNAPKEDKKASGKVKKPVKKQVEDDDEDGDDD